MRKCSKAGLLSTIVVDALEDVVNGNASNVAGLLSSHGADGKISLREAIVVANSSDLTIGMNANDTIE